MGRGTLIKQMGMAATLLLLCLTGGAWASGQQAPVPPVSPPADAEVAEVEAPSPFLGGFLRETRIVYPLKLGIWSAVKEHRYDDPTDGVSVRYQHGDDTDRWADVYFYPVGVLSDEQVKQVAEGERRGLEKVWLQGPDANDDDISALTSYTFGPRRHAKEKNEEKPGLRTAYAVDLTYESKGDRRNSAMVVVYQQLYTLKTRYSVRHQAAARRALMEELEAFTTELAQDVSISSTGGCWSPLPIEPLVEGQPAPEGYIMNMDTDGVPTEYVYEDRVLAKDPGSDTASTAALLGMAMTDRIYPGCDGAEPVNPTVPEGMREIRIEYRQPAKSISPPSGPGPRPVERG